MTKKNFIHNLRVTLNLSIDYALIAGLIYFHQNVVSGPFTYIAICWLIGIKQFSIGEALLHEASHGLLFYPKKLNRISAILVAYPFFHTIDSYRLGHSKHHKLLAQEGDPLLVRAIELSKQKSFFSEWFLKPLIGFHAYNTVKKNIEKLRQPKHRPILFFWSLVILFCVSQGLVFELIIYWLIPLYWCQATLVHWSELTDHYMVEAPSRSVSSWVYNFLVAHNGGYHAAHHHRPNVPFYQLPKLQAKESANIQTEWTTGYWDTYKTIRRRHYQNLECSRRSSNTKR